MRFLLHTTTTIVSFLLDLFFFLSCVLEIEHPNVQEKTRCYYGGSQTDVGVLDR
jgi:hypothetical protein